MTATEDDYVSQVLDGVRRLDRGLRLTARRVERETGLSAAQLFVLEHLSQAEPLSMAELARLTLTDRSSVSVVVDRLVDAGLASKTTAEGDRRRAEVRITRRGKEKLRKAPTPPTDLLIDALRDMPRTTVRQLGVALDSLNARLGFTEAKMLFEDR